MGSEVGGARWAVRWVEQGGWSKVGGTRWAVRWEEQGGQ